MQYTLSGNAEDSPVPVLFCRFLASETDNPAGNTVEGLLPKPQYEFLLLLFNTSNWQLGQRITVANCCQNIRRYRSSDFDLIHSDFADFETKDIDNPGNIEMLPKPQYKFLLLLFNTRSYANLGNTDLEAVAEISGQLSALAFQQKKPQYRFLPLLLFSKRNLKNLGDNV